MRTLRAKLSLRLILLLKKNSSKNIMFARELTRYSISNILENKERK
jgi:hypothetical protein